MKKTLSVNLGGMVYHIDEDAYALLTDYLQDVRHHLGDEASSEEVLKDIEQRMSELFTEWMHGNREVVTKPDVERVVDILGRPEQYESEEAGTSGMGNASFAERPNDRRLRKLYRDPQNAILAGVCSGMGYYLNVGAVLPRLVFVLLTWFGGSGILLYLLCWIIIPEAKTAAQRLDMQGEDVTVENIEKKVREEYGKAKDRVGNYVNNAHIDQQARSIGYGIGQFFVTFFKIIFGFIAGVIGLVGFTVLLALIVALIAMWCGNVTVMSDWTNQVLPMHNWLLNPSSATMIILGIILTIGIPFIAVFYLLFGRTLNMKPAPTWLTWVSVVLWLLGIGFLTVACIAYFNQFGGIWI
ncbi:MAG: PspC domain-containing protein [Bacteroidota bacterium]|nr:PspC domain-containing protein [Bacteroidota bacterium]